MSPQYAAPNLNSPAARFNSPRRASPGGGEKLGSGEPGLGALEEGDGVVLEAELHEGDRHGAFPEGEAEPSRQALGLLVAVPELVGARLPVYSAALIFVVLFLSLALLTSVPQPGWERTSKRSMRRRAPIRPTPMPERER